MSGLSSILAKPISWTSGTVDPDLRSFLQDMQANILKGHGRHHTVNLFLGFAGMAPKDVAAVVRRLGDHCTSAHQQLRTNRKFPPHLDGGIVRCLFLSASGYRALGPKVAMPPGAAFQAGMEKSAGKLADRPRSQWDAVGWRQGAPDAMLLLANRDANAALEADLQAIEGWLNGTGVKIAFIERGLQQTRSFQKDKPEGVEHFGYVDGRSQPLVLAEDIKAEAIPKDPPKTKPEDKKHWDPAFNPSQFIVKDPNGRLPVSAGSYFVYRKLEQNVRGFNAAEKALAKQIFTKPGSPTNDESDRAGAMVVGRFEDGTPLVLSKTGQKADVTNDFSYAGDPDGAKCPFHAHIRKTNPRGDIDRAIPGVGENAGRDPIMIRRGITYGPLRPHNADQSEFADADKEPVSGSGLLFMAYMASIEAQFEFTQQSWANSPTFAGNIDAKKNRPPTGIDPVIGQTSDKTQLKHTYQDGWTNDPVSRQLSFDKFVSLMGGEYFFAPSLSFLRSVGL